MAKKQTHAPEPQDDGRGIIVVAVTDDGQLDVQVVNVVTVGVPTILRLAAKSYEKQLIGE